MRFLVVGACLDRIVLFQMKVAQDDLVAGFHRVFGGQILDLLKRRVRLFERVVELVFLHRQRFVHADRRFEGVVGVDSLADFAFLGEGFRQIIIELRLAGVRFDQLLVFLGGFAIHSEVAGDGSQRHAVGEVVGTVGNGTFQHVDCLFGAVQLYVER